MEIKLYMIGQTSMPFIASGMAEFSQRIGKYARFSQVVLPLPKSAGKLPPEEQKRREANLILKVMESEGCSILLDERGTMMDSRGFAAFLQKRMNHVSGSIAFFIGGAWGFSPEVRTKADHSLSLSAMTYSHQLIRVVFLEQLYRAFTILRNEPYHND